MNKHLPKVSPLFVFMLFLVCNFATLPWLVADETAQRPFLARIPRLIGGEAANTETDTSETSNRAYNAGEGDSPVRSNTDSATISFVDSANGTKLLGSEVSITVKVKNTGTRSRFFWVGLSFYNQYSGDWPNGWLDVPPIKTSKLSTNSTEEITFVFEIPLDLPEKDHRAVTAVWDDYDEQNNQVIGIGPKNDSYDSKDAKSFLPSSSGLDSDPHRLGIHDKGGLFYKIPVGMRQRSLDIPANLNNNLKDAHHNGRELSIDDRQIMVLFHGWKGAKPNAYNSGEWGKLANNLKNGALPDDWSLVEYHWERDSHTGDLISAYPSDTRGIIAGIAGLVIPYWPVAAEQIQRNATRAAFYGYQNGIVLGKKLVEQVGAGRLQKIHLVAHSAGSWCAYAAMRYINYYAPQAELQVTYLDPFIPSKTLLPDDLVGSFNPSVLEGTVNYTKIFTDGAKKAEAYWAMDKLTDWASLTFPTTVSWSWANEPDAVVVRTDEATFGTWGGHSGPIKYYAESIKNPDAQNIKKKGWNYALAKNSPVTSTITLSNARVDPSSGDTETTFTFRIDYYDKSGNWPQDAKLYIDGVTYNLSLETGTPANGTFKYSTRLPEGYHYYWFNFKAANGRWIESNAVQELKVEKYVLPRGNIVVLRPSVNPFSTSDDGIILEVIAPDRANEVKCYNDNLNIDKNLRKSNLGFWQGSIDLELKCSNKIIIQALDNNTLLDETNIIVTHQENITNITLGQNSFVSRGVWDVEPGKNIKTGESWKDWQIGYDFGGFCWFLIRFDNIEEKLIGAELSQGINSCIQSAELRVKVWDCLSTGEGTQEITAAAIHPDWEYEIEYATWYNRPTYFYAISKTSVDSYFEKISSMCKVKPFLRFDVTTSIKNWLTYQWPNKGFMLWDNNWSYGFSRGFPVNNCYLNIIYTHETTPPDITISHPNNNFRVANSITEITISGNAHDSTGISIVKWRNASTGTDGTCIGKENWSCTVDLNVGENKIVVSAEDLVGNIDSSTIFLYRAEPEKLPTPFASPFSGSYRSPLSVEVFCSEPDVVIRYTDDGQEPSEDSPVWSNDTENLIELPKTLKLKAFKPGWLPSETYVADYSRIFNVTVESGLGSGYYEKNNIIIIQADPAPYGYDSFLRWSVIPEQYDNRFFEINSAITIFVIPDDDVTITANYRLNLYEVFFQLDHLGIHSGGGDLSQMIAHGEKAIMPKVQAKGNWEFYGWDAGIDWILEPCTIKALYSFNYNLTAGWNLISINLNLTEESIQLLAAKNAFILSPENNSYIHINAWNPRQTCWIFCNENDTMTLIGTAPESPDFPSKLHVGWNFVGPIEDCILVGDDVSAWGWNGQSFYPTENLYSGEGYFIYSPDGQIEISQPFSTAEYIVVDLSAGPDATSYPVSNLRAVVPADGWTDEYKTTKLVLRRIPAGTFMMGSPENELGRGNNETQHQVTLTKDFYIGVFQVTQKQWERVMGDWPSYFENPAYRNTRPVENVSYDDVRGANKGSGWPANNDVDAGSFLGRLRNRTGLTFDLPTEAQWEYACRAGTATALNSGKNLINTQQCPNMDAVGRYLHNVGSGYSWNGTTAVGTAKVGSYLPNQWGLYDMHGNIWEWCLDRYQSDLGKIAQTDPQGDPNRRPIGRGGCWDYPSEYCRSAFRDACLPSWRDYGLGFRLTFIPDQPTGGEEEKEPIIEFFEDWETGQIDETKWKIWGHPSPSIVSGGNSLGNYAITSNGDANWESGVTSRQGFKIKPGMTFETQMYVEDPGTDVWSKRSWHAFTLSSRPPDEWGNNLGVLDSTIGPSFYLRGNTPTDNAFSIETPDGDLAFESRPYLDHWVKIAFTFNVNGSVTYFVDGVEWHTTTANWIDYNNMPLAHIVCGGRSEGPQVINLHDNIVVRQQQK